jgi:hypothetical protein
MWDIFAQLVEINKTIPYNSVWFWVGVYLFCLWVIIAYWAGRDARKRYPKSKLLAFIWFLVVATFNIPALLLYLTVRPEEPHGIELPADPHNINVPLNTLITGNRLVISLELQSDNQATNNLSVHELAQPEQLASQLVQKLVINAEPSDKQALVAENLSMQPAEQLTTAQQINES